MGETWRATAKAQMRDRYLHVAAHLFAERGYNGVSIEDLGAAAGVSGPALYRHFSSKESILIELLVSASERLLSGCRATIVSGNPPLSTLTQLIDFHIDFSLSEPSIIRIQDRELANLSAESNQRVRRLQREYVANWIGVLSKLVPELTEREVNVRVIAAFGLMNSTPFSARAGELELARGILAEMTITSLLGGARGPATFIAGATKAGTQGSDSDLVEPRVLTEDLTRGQSSYWSRPEPTEQGVRHGNIEVAFGDTS